MKSRNFCLLVNGYIPHPLDPLSYVSFVPGGGGGGTKAGMVCVSDGFRYVCGEHSQS